MHHAFLYISLPSLHDYNVKVPEWLAAKLAFPREFVKEVGLTEPKKGKTLGGEGTFITNCFINFSLRHRQSGNVPSIVMQIFSEKFSGDIRYLHFLLTASWSKVIAMPNLCGHSRPKIKCVTRQLLLKTHGVTSNEWH